VTIVNLAKSWEVNVRESAENFSKDFAVTVLPQGTESPESVRLGNIPERPAP
jgi:hypothetical protein